MNQQNKFLWDGVDLEELAKRHGTPLYVYSISKMENQINKLKAAFTDNYPQSRIAYASKAFLNKAMVGFIKKQGLCLDVVSGGELQLALEAGMPPERIELNGNNKLPSEIELAMKNRVGRIIVDGTEELDLIEYYGKIYNYVVPVLFRITPGITADSHEYIITGRKDSKFGFPLDENLLPHIEKALNGNFIDFYGFHFHLGSQLFEHNIYVDALDLLFNYIDTYLSASLEIKELNIGGGFGINYLPEDRAKGYEEFFLPVLDKITKYFDHRGQKPPTIVTEPGRSIVGEAGLTLYRVGSIKKIEGLRTYVSVDGGMADNIRPALYQARYNGLLVSKAHLPAQEVVTIVGKCCESGDILIKDIPLPQVEKGDLLAVFSTGAYGYSMASNYNLLPKPGIVWVKEGKDYLVTQAQKVSQIYENDFPFPL